MRKEIIQCDRCKKYLKTIDYIIKFTKRKEEWRGEGKEFCDKCYEEIKTFAIKNKE